MKRPTITLAMICKDELHNFPVLLKSIEGCFDEIHVTDTGSTDGTLEYLRDFAQLGTIAGAKFVLKQFNWCDDFAAARNHSYSDIKTDFAMWMDLDDSLSDREAFIKWRDTAMCFADHWFCTYNYAYDNAEPVLAFLRERVVRMSFKPKWQFFIHEGILPSPNMRCNNTFAWTINHRRTIEEATRDRGRNLKVIEKHMAAGEKIPNRLKYYYGKELADMGDFMNSWRVLKEVVALPMDEIEKGDRILALECLARSAVECASEQNPQGFAEAVKYLSLGLQLDLTRSEYWCLWGDVMFRQGQMREAYALYNTARKMPNNNKASGKHHDFLHRIDTAYGHYPIKQLAKCLHNIGQFDTAILELKSAHEQWPHDGEITEMLKLEEDALRITSRDADKITKTQDIVLTTPPVAAYPWDDKLYREKGLGGSETAAVEMMHWLRKLTGRNVIIFNVRESEYTSDDGVQYRPVQKSNDYFSRFEPALHIAWRHNMWVTDAPTYLWCHDLYTPGVEEVQNFNKLLCLSEFHKDYIMSMQGLKPDQFLMTRNGIDPKRFKNQVAKNPNKIVFPSSPDRGLERAISIIEKAREKLPDLELHVYYGFENLKKFGLAAKADMLERMIADRPWVKYHGNVKQDVLAQEMMEAVVWLYPADFIESFCITALEAQAAYCYPIVRDIGALPYTLKDAIADGSAQLIDRDALKEEDVKFWADAVTHAIETKKYQRMGFDAEEHSWESVARDWIRFFDLKDVDKVITLPRTIQSNGDEVYQQASLR
jgi:glycosyltransferase involved in cell wall biosynthesis